MASTAALVVPAKALIGRNQEAKGCAPSQRLSLSTAMPRARKICVRRAVNSRADVVKESLQY